MECHARDAVAEEAVQVAPESIDVQTLPPYTPAIRRSPSADVATNCQDWLPGCVRATHVEPALDEVWMYPPSCTTTSFDPSEDAAEAKKLPENDVCPVQVQPDAYVAVQMSPALKARSPSDPALALGNARG